jgi:pimeloyl-ACP methyl ester carboxylesterase
MIMSAVSSSPTWRTFLATVAAAGAFGLALLAAPSDAQTVPSSGAQASVSGLGAAVENTAVRPFHIDVPEEALVDLRRRIAATRWPERETVDDFAQGVQLAKIQELVRYWGTDYDWRKAEAKLNALPQFVTNIDGLDIHFIHVRSRHPNALPLIMTHGWPGSVFELLKVIGPLTDPTAHRGVAEDAFDLVLPSMPGYGFSEKPNTTSWGPDRIARAWDVLMKRLGYTRYVSQGGDWGAIIADVMGRQAPPGLLGIHVNRVDRSATIPPEVAKALNNGEPAPADLTAEERAVFDQTKDFYKQGTGYAAIMGTRPQTIGYGLADSPVGLAAWCYDKFADWVFTRGKPERSLTRDEMLDDVTLYWLTNTGTSGARLYWENNANPSAVDVSIPAAVTVFPGEIYRPPKSWAERAYHQLIYYHRVDKGGHFAAWEEPQLFSEEIRAAFRSLR